MPQISKEELTEIYHKATEQIISEIISEKRDISSTKGAFEEITRKLIETELTQLTNSSDIKENEIDEIFKQIKKIQKEELERT